MKQGTDTTSLPEDLAAQLSVISQSPHREGNTMTGIANAKAPGSRTNPRSGRRVQAPVSMTVKHILIPTDLREKSEKAVNYGLVLARRFGAHLTLLHVYRDPYSVDYLRGPQACAAVSKLRCDAQMDLAAMLGKVAEQYADCSAEFRYGAVCEEIARTVKEREIDLIVISTHHYGWLTRFAYGCDAEQILRHAPCPILIV